MSSHHKARRLALQGLCCLDVQGAKAMEPIEEFIADSEEPQGVLSDAREMLGWTFRNRPSCDEMLARHARHWDLSRLAMVDRNILRLAVQELLGRKTPFKVVIAEALRLAREFSTAESPRFVNGVLDAVAREIHDHDSRGSGDTGDEAREE